MLTIVALVAVAVFGGWLLFGSAGPVTTVPATVVDTRFEQERGPDGRTRVRLRTEDGRDFTAVRPGRQALAGGDRVRIVVAGKRVLRVLPPSG